MNNYNDEKKFYEDLDKRLYTFALLIEREAKAVLEDYDWESDMIVYLSKEETRRKMKEFKKHLNNRRKEINKVRRSYKEE